MGLNEPDATFFSVIENSKTATHFCVTLLIFCERFGTNMKIRLSRCEELPSSETNVLFRAIMQDGVGPTETDRIEAPLLEDFRLIRRV